MSKKLTKKQIGRRAQRRAQKAQRMRDHEKRHESRQARRRVVRGNGPRVVLDLPGARSRRRQRRNGARWRVGGR